MSRHWKWCLLAAAALSAFGQSGTPLVWKADRHDESRPLRELALTAQPQAPGSIRILPLRQLPKPTGPEQADPVRQTNFGPALLTTPGLNFDGIGQGVYGFSDYYAPPDPNGAVGATQYVQWINVNYAVFSKTTGALVLGPVAGNTLWSGFGGNCETTNSGDPIAQYDKAANRWLLTQFSLTSGGPFYQCIAVSTSSDATGTYYRYSFPMQYFPDYPKFGVWPDAYYMSFNSFDAFGSSFLGAEACAFDRNSMLTGAAATAVCFQQPSTIASLLPSDLDGRTPPPAGSPNYFLNYGTNSLNLWKFHVDFVTPTNSTFTGPATLPVAPFTPVCGTGFTCIPQTGSTQLLDSLDDRLMYRLAYRNFGAWESMVVNHSVKAGAGGGVRWYELRNPGTAPVVYQQGTYAPDSKYRWMGSIAMDKAGDIAVGYSVSSSASYPSIAYSGRIAADPLGQLEAENSIVTGTGSQQSGLSRWGDYSAMSIDPVDDCTFWYTAEYLQASGIFNWNTRIASFSFPGCTGSTVWSLSVSKIGAGTGTVSSKPAGIACGAICAASYTNGTNVTLKAAVGKNSVFAGWTGACSGAGTCTVAMTATQSVTATFNSTLPSYSVSVTETGTGSGAVTSFPAGISCAPTCSATFVAGTSLKLVATAVTGSKFTGWSGGCTGTAATCTVAVTSNLSANANFDILVYPLTVMLGGTGTGTVASSPAGIHCSPACSANYSPGTMVTLTATVPIGVTWVGWSGACSGTSLACTVTMSSAKTVTAKFNNPTITVSNPDQGGTVTSSPAGLNCGPICSAPFAASSAVTLTATPSGVIWSGACTGTQQTCTLTMDASKAVTVFWP